MYYCQIFMLNELMNLKWALKKVNRLMLFFCLWNMLNPGWMSLTLELILEWSFYLSLWVFYFDFEWNFGLEMSLMEVNYGHTVVELEVQNNLRLSYLGFEPVSFHKIQDFIYVKKKLFYPILCNITFWRRWKSPFLYVAWPV